MHSLRMAENILQLVLREAGKHAGKRVASIHVILPDRDSTESESLAFCLEAMSQGTAAEGAQIEIEVVPILARCPRCEKDFVVDPYHPDACPQCHGSIDLLYDEEFPAVAITLE